MKKYRLTDETITIDGKTFYRIQALIDISGIYEISAGEMGGFIEKEENLSHDGNAWVFGNALVCGNAQVCDNALVCGNALVGCNAQVRVDGRVNSICSVLVIGPIGSRGGSTTFYLNSYGGINVSCGCFTGSISDFEKAVQETHGESIFAKEYAAAIQLAKIHIRKK